MGPPRNSSRVLVLVVVIVSPPLGRAVDNVIPRPPRPAPPTLLRAAGTVKLLFPRPANPALSHVVDIVKVMLSRPLRRECRPQRSIVNYKVAKEPEYE